MVGDILNDVEAGNQAGCRTVLLNNGNETEWIIARNRKPTALAGDLDEAASLILQMGHHEK
jgi:phosphoglycolate phosphatase-like HAD superfamily hydrolase